MTTEQLQKLHDKIVEKQKELLNTKGKEYQNNDVKDEVFSNFERLGENLGLEMTTVAMVYITKHFDSLSNFIKKLEKAPSISSVENTLSEPIEGRILDLMNYLLSVFLKKTPTFRWGMN